MANSKSQAVFTPDRKFWKDYHRAVTPKLPTARAAQTDTRFALTHAQLLEAARAAIKAKLNRQLLISKLKKLPKDRMYPVTALISHHHSAFKKTEAHVRAFFKMPNDTSASLDIPAALFLSFVPECTPISIPVIG